MSILSNATNTNVSGSSFTGIGGDQNIRNTIVNYGSAHHEEILARLKPVEQQESFVPGCMEGTREEVFRTIDHWLADFNAPNILWLSGSPGAGKSAVASSLVSKLTNWRLGSYFFFKRDHPQFNDPTVVWRTVSFDLAHFNPGVKRSLVEFLGRLGTRDADIRLHFKCMIRQPLLDHFDSLSAAPPVIVLDGLDECGSYDLQSTQLRDVLLDTLVSWSGLPSKFKLIVTSRDERVPELFYDEHACRRIVLETGDSVSPETVKDLSIYFAKSFANISPRMGLPQTWPGETKIHELSLRAGGLFIWAETAMAFMVEQEVEDGNEEDRLDEEQTIPSVRLKLILAGRMGQATENIDALYQQILHLHFSASPNSLLTLFRAVVGTIIVAKVPIRRDNLKHFLGLQGTEVERKFNLILHRLSSIISNGDHGDGLLRLRHLSFAEFLTDAERCQDSRFFIDLSAQCHGFALACLRLMNQGLKFNICGLSTSYRCNDAVDDLSSRIERSIPPHLSYSCRFWAEHLGDLTKTQDVHSVLLKEIEIFLYTHLLHWLEALSLLKQVSVASMALLTTACWVESVDADLAAFAKDGSRFVANFYVPIVESAPHVYLSALPFSPTSSRVSQRFLPQFSQTLAITGLESEWLALINTLTGHKDSVLFISFSHDGKHIVSGSSDETIRIWDAETGQMISGPLEGHTDWVGSVVFSPDGKQVVSGSSDQTVCIWDVETGQKVSGPFEGHTDKVWSVAFSPNGKTVISGSSDKTICIWDAETGQMLSSSPFQGHTDKVWSVAFSPDGKFVVSGSSDMTVCIWNAETGKMALDPLTGHTDIVWSVAFSPDGKSVVSGSSDKTISIWDAETGEILLPPFKGHADSVWSVAFSPDGKYIVSGSTDKTICIWDVKTGQLVSGPFEGHTDWIASVTFSPDGKWIASGSFDQVIHIWDAEVAQTAPGHFEGHTDSILYIAFSPDGKHVVSGSSDKTIRIWDAKTGQMISGPFEGHTDWVGSVAFSPDGKHIVSGSKDKTVCIWDVYTCQRLSDPFKGHTDNVWSVAFSPNGKFVISGSSDKTICVWDIERRQIQSGPFKGHSDQVWSVAFSPDGKSVVSGSSDKTVLIWDIETGNILSIFKGHKGIVWSVAFSPNGEFVVSGSEDKTIRIWNVEQKKLALDPFIGHSDSVWSVAFSPNGRHIVSGSTDRTICVWDAMTGDMILGPFKGHTDWIASVVFSPDGKCVASGSFDKMIRIWDASWQISDHSALGASKFDKGFQVPEDFSDGWIKQKDPDDPDNSLLFWVPSHHRQLVCSPQTLAIMGTRQIVIDFSRFAHGNSWVKCCPSSSVDYEA